MKTPKYLIVLLVLLLAGTEISAQRVVVEEEAGHPRRAREEVVVTRSRYRPARVVVYHPYWGPHFDYHRRWIYFPRYNIYWDNWRNHYVFRNGNVWISQPTAPPVLVNVNLNKARAVELSEKEDDMDEIYQSNGVHKLQNQ